MREAYGEAGRADPGRGRPARHDLPRTCSSPRSRCSSSSRSSAGKCVQHSTAVQLAGAPELNRRMISQSIGSVGPAGMLLADDTEMYERNQRGVASAPARVAATCAAGCTGSDRRARPEGRHGHRRDRDARLLGALPVPDGGSVTADGPCDRAHLPRGPLRRRARLRRLGSAVDRHADRARRDWPSRARMSVIHDNRNRITTRLNQLPWPPTSCWPSRASAGC